MSQLAKQTNFDSQKLPYKAPVFKPGRVYNSGLDIKFNPDYKSQDKLVLREPGGEYHTDSELREVYASMLSTQYFQPFESKPGYFKYRRVLVDWM